MNPSVLSTAKQFRQVYLRWQSQGNTDEVREHLMDFIYTCKVTELSKDNLIRLILMTDELLPAKSLVFKIKKETMKC